MRDTLESLRFAVITFVVALLPERVKAHEPWRSYSTVAAHVTSGVVETALAVGLFGLGALSFLGAFSSAYTFTLATRAPHPTTSDLGRMGILGFVSYMLTPWAMATFFCIVEGVLRGLDAVFSARFLGLSFLSAPHWLVLRLRDHVRRARLEAKLGPPRPDRVEPPEATRDGSLRITCRDAKPWSDLQVVEFGAHFFQLHERTFVRDDAYFAWRYVLRELDCNDVLRGTVIRYDPAAPPPAPATPPPVSAAPRRWLEALLVRRPPRGRARRRSPGTSADPDPGGDAGERKGLPRRCRGPGERAGDAAPLSGRDADGEDEGDDARGAEDREVPPADGQAGGAGEPQDGPRRAPRPLPRHRRL
jgi:hypothetical protein